MTDAVQALNDEQLHEFLARVNVHAADVMVAWDHHTADEGLRIDLRDVHTTSRLLADLNSVGVELELFYTDG